MRPRRSLLHRRAIGAALAGALCLSASGCTATLQRRGAPRIEAVIESSDEQGLQVRVKNRSYRVAGEQLEDIDHPGNVLMVLGGVALGMAAFSLAIFSAAGAPPEFLISTGVVYGGTGVGLLVGGGIPWTLSRRAAMAYEHRPRDQEQVYPAECLDPGRARTPGCPSDGTADLVPASPL
jgi:hypothetical protein